MHLRIEIFTNIISPRILAQVSKVSPREFSPEISDDHMVLGGEDEQQTRHIQVRFQLFSSETDRQKVEMSKCLPGRRELFFLGIKNNIVKPF